MKTMTFIGRSRIQLKRYMPTILLLIILLSIVSFALIFFLHYGLGKSLSLAGYILLAASILSFLFFLSIDPGYGWIKPSNLYKNYIVISILVTLFILSVILIVVGNRVSESQNHTICQHGDTEYQGAYRVATAATGFKEVISTS